jgi:hypothetical protein
MRGVSGGDAGFGSSTGGDWEGWAFPKWESLKINPEKVENFRAGKVTIHLPAFTSDPPRIYHQKTMFCTLFLPKPPAKT